ncbi:uroporphyrinogen decarboxylase family protein [Candidatus Latescibacterota bacterium]
MTSRERVRAAINHREPDRVPVDFGGTFETGISASTVYFLREALGLNAIDERTKVVEPYQMLGEIKYDLRDTMHVDTTALYNTGTAFGFPLSGWKEWDAFDSAKLLVPGMFNTEPNENGDIFMYPEGDRSAPPSAVMPKDGYYFDSIIRQHPIDDENLHVEDNLEEFGIYPDELLAYLERQSKFLFENTDRSLVYGFTGTSFGDVANTTGPELKNPKGIRDTTEWYMSFITRKEYIKEVFEGECEIGLANLKRVFEAVGNRIDVIKITGADYGSQRGPLVSPEWYREMIKPLHVKMCGWIHENTTWKIFMHCCGGIRPLLDDFIDAGFDIISPVQTNAEGMEASGLKKDFGDRLVFWGGGVDTQSTLPFGTPEEVYNEIVERIDIFNRDGGYVFNPIHNVQPNTPIENILAMIEAIKKHV